MPIAARASSGLPQRVADPQRRPIARAQTAPASQRPPPTLQEAPTDHIRGLEVAMSAVIVSVSALRRQNCDIDEDIARVLERSAADRLDVEIEKPHLPGPPSARRV